MQYTNVNQSFELDLQLNVQIENIRNYEELSQDEINIIIEKIKGKLLRDIYYELYNSNDLCYTNVDIQGIGYSELILNIQERK
jgi:hypothetical protein